jgi:hypothetical protein
MPRVLHDRRSVSEVQNPITSSTATGIEMTGADEAGPAVGAPPTATGDAASETLRPLPKVSAAAAVAAVHARDITKITRALAFADVLFSLILWALSIDSVAGAFSGYDFTDGGSNLLGVVVMAIVRAVVMLLVTCKGVALAWQLRACVASAIVLIVKGAGFFSEWHTGALDQVLLAGSMVMVLLE